MKLKDLKPRPIIINKGNIDNQKLSGIYGIMSKETERLYIGSSINIKRRLLTHKKQLKNNCHHSRFLQNHYNKYGIGDLTFMKMKDVENTKQLIKEEQKFIDILNPCFNVNKSASSCLGVIRSKETRKRISEARMRMNIKHSDEYKENMSKLLSGENNPMYGKSGSDSPNWGKKHKPETIAKMVLNHMDCKGKNNPNYGKIMSKEQIKKANKTKRIRLKERRGSYYFDFEGVKHECLTYIDIARVFNVQPSSIRRQYIKTATFRGIEIHNTK